MRVLHAASEYQGIAKTGGLADMVAALATAQVAQGIDVRACVPAYTGTRELLLHPVTVTTLKVRSHQVSVIEGRLSVDGPLLWLIDCPELFDRGVDASRKANPYRGDDGVDFTDNALRFGVFSAAVARLAQGATKWIPDVVHLHDWHCGLAAPWLAIPSTSIQTAAIKTRRPRILFTIHNLAHQGLFNRSEFDALSLPPTWWQIDGVEFYGQLSFMKAGLQYSDVITTVSPTYAQEIQTPAYGCDLDGALRARSNVLHGIVNGIDDAIWNPATDTLVAERYSLQSTNNLPSITAGKLRNKQALRKQLNLPDHQLPLVIFIGRLADQKGADLLLAAREEIRKLPLQFVLLGSGDRALERECLEWAAAAPEQVRVLLQVDETLAHQLTAAADLQIMPSRFEPCGLNQMYAQRYGAIPIVRRTGGLADTVVDTTTTTLADGSATGITFEHADTGGVLYGLNRGLELVSDLQIRDQLRSSGMARDFSWRHSAQEYLRLYGLATPH